MTTTTVADVMECGGRVTIEQVLIFVDAPLVVLLVLAVVFTALTSMTSKKTSSVPGVCTMFLKMSSQAILRNRRRLRDQTIVVRVTDTNGKSCKWVEFNPRFGTIYLDLPLPTRQSHLALVEMRITCPDTYHRPSSQYLEWSESATSQLRCLMPLSIQSRRLDYQMATTSSTVVTTPSGDAKVVYPLIPRPIKSSAQDKIERGCLAWLSLCLAGLLSFGITQYINLAYSEFATAVVMNVLDILITTANVIVAVTSGVLAFVFVKILATPLRRYNRLQRRGKYRRLSGHTLGHDLGGIKTSVMSPPIIQFSEPDGSITGAELQASGDSDATEKTVDHQSILPSPDVPTAPDKLTWEDELHDNKVKLAKPFKSKSLPCLDCLTLKSANPSPSRHFLLTCTSASLKSLESRRAFFSTSCEKEESSPMTNKPPTVTEESPLQTNQPPEVTAKSPSLTSKVTGESSPLTNKSKSLPSLDCLTLKSANPSLSRHSLPTLTSATALQSPSVFFPVSCEKAESCPLTNKPAMITEESSPLTNQPAEITAVTFLMTKEPTMVTEETSPLTNEPQMATEGSLPLTNEPTMVTTEISEGAPGLNLPRSSESSTSVSSTFTIESLPEELPGGIYRTEKYIYKECSTPWHYNSWIDDPPFQSSVYLDWLNDTNKDNNNNNNNNNNNVSTVDLDIEEDIEVTELAPPRINITRSYAPLLLVMFAMLGSVIALHIYVVKTSLCQQILEASIISWALASLVLMIIWLTKQTFDLWHRCIKN